MVKHIKNTVKYKNGQIIKHITFPNTVTCMGENKKTVAGQYLSDIAIAVAIRYLTTAALANHKSAHLAYT